MFLVFAISDGSLDIKGYFRSTSPQISQNERQALYDRAKSKFLEVCRDCNLLDPEDHEAEAEALDEGHVSCEDYNLEVWFLDLSNFGENGVKIFVK